MVLFSTKIVCCLCTMVLLTKALTTSDGLSKSVRKQYIDTNSTNTASSFDPHSCKDDPQKYALCVHANKPCHCEENRYEMYTYCKRSCGFCAREKTPQRFWRIVNWAPLNRTWYVNEIQFFQSKHDEVPLVTNDPTKAIASSTYLSFPASNAFDGNSDSSWLPDGWWERQAGGDWIGYDFPAPVDINSVRIVSDQNDTSDVSSKMLVEAGPTPFGPFDTRWMIVNYERIADKRFNNPKCPLFWKRFMTDKDAFCYKVITEYLTWAEARDKCATYGGDLVSITMHEEQIFVQQELIACGFTWIGLNDIEKEQHFRWSDGSNTSFLYWASDEDKDDRMNEMEDCAAMAHDGQWRQFHCEDRFYAFCKKRILTDNDKVVAPNTPTTTAAPPVNQSTLPPGVPPPPTVLPPGIDLPPGVTTPTPPPYPYPYPTKYPSYPGTTYPYPYPYTTPAPAIGSTPPPQQSTTAPTPASGTPTPSAPEPGTPEPTTPMPGTPKPGTPAPATPPPTPGTPPPAAGTPPPTPGTSPPAPGTPPPAPGTPPPAPGTPPPTPGTQQPAPASAPLPAPAVVPPPAPAPQPSIAPIAVPPPAPFPASHMYRSKKLHDKRQRKVKEKFLHKSRKGKRKQKRHHKKTEIKKFKYSPTKKGFYDQLEPVNNENAMEDILEMVTRSNIPQPRLPEPTDSLRPGIRKQEMGNAEKKLRH